VKSFFQQTIAQEDEWKTAIVTQHRGQEQFTVVAGTGGDPGVFLTLNRDVVFRILVENRFGVHRPHHRRLFADGSWFWELVHSSAICYLEDLEHCYHHMLILKIETLISSAYAFQTRSFQNNLICQIISFENGHVICWTVRLVFGRLLQYLHMQFLLNKGLS
jgi:hypothetical protein